MSETKLGSLKGVDFLDFGASKAASIDYGVKHLFGKKGMGVDLDPVRVQAMNDGGYACMVGDLTDLAVPENCVRFVKMSHILEHMPDLPGVEKAIASAAKAATDFLVITGPFFDEDDYLKSLGLKLDWADYPEHTCHLTITDLMKILKRLGLGNYQLHVRYIIRDSSSNRIHPLASPAGSHQYDKKIHPRKKQVTFDKNIWTDFVCYIKLKNSVPKWELITQAYNDQLPYAFTENNVVTITPTFALNAMAAMDEDLRSQKETSRVLKKQNEKLAVEARMYRHKLRAVTDSKAWQLTSKARKLSSVLKQRTNPTKE